MDRCHAIENWGFSRQTSTFKLPGRYLCQIDALYIDRCILFIFHLYIFQFINKHISVVIRSLEAQVARAFSTLKIRDDLLFDDIADEVWWVLLLDLLQLMTN